MGEENGGIWLEQTLLADETSGRTGGHCQGAGFGRWDRGKSGHQVSVAEKKMPKQGTQKRLRHHNGRGNYDAKGRRELSGA